ncbi:hypothetical protein CLF_106772 [Clonorchis sinensis]|uniref:Uncharacterized protein n=1 Tax=Clonorchis sinensis TaxID=79923 RepID=G7YFN7_CLOSI|nr:hypothetical protein CLF_106772 [Clonorchis sinensis]
MAVHLGSSHGFGHLDSTPLRSWELSDIQTARQLRIDHFASYFWAESDLRFDLSIKRHNNVCSSIDERTRCATHVLQPLGAKTSVPTFVRKVQLTTVRYHILFKVIRATLREPVDQLQLLILIGYTSQTPGNRLCTNLIYGESGNNYDAYKLAREVTHDFDCDRKSVSLHNNPWELTVGHRFQEQSTEMVTVTLSIFFKTVHQFVSEGYTRSRLKSFPRLGYISAMWT